MKSTGTSVINFSVFLGNKLAERAAFLFPPWLQALKTQKKAPQCLFLKSNHNRRFTLA